MGTTASPEAPVTPVTPAPATPAPAEVADRGRQTAQPEQKGPVARMHEIAQSVQKGLKDGTIKFGAPAEPAKPATPAAEATPAAPAPAKPAAPLPERDASTGKFVPTPKVGEEPPPAAGDATADTSELPDEEAGVEFAFPAAEGQEAHVVVIPADDEATIQHLQALTTQAARAETLVRELETMEADREKYGAIEHHLRHDPVSFVTARVHDNIAKDVALALIARPGVLEAIKDTVGEWAENPDARRADFAELQSEVKERTRKLQDDYRGQVKEERFVNQLVRRVEQVSRALPSDRASMFVDDALGALEAHFRRPGVEIRSPSDEELVGMIKSRLGLYNVTETDALSALKGGKPSRQPPTAKPTAEAAKKLEDAKGNGRRFVQSREARQRALAVPPSTGGAPTATPAATPPAGQKLSDRFDWVRNRFGLTRSGPRERGPGIPKAQ